jgi:hypothetical protein
VCHSLLSSHIILTLLDSEACITFRPGKQCDEWFNSDHLLTQVNQAIDLFNCMSNGQAQGLFIFDNISSHQKHTLDAISAHHMVKGTPLSLSPYELLIDSLGPEGG